jgi:hypothetical protein
VFGWGAILCVACGSSNGGALSGGHGGGTSQTDAGVDGGGASNGGGGTSNGGRGGTGAGGRGGTGQSEDGGANDGTGGDVGNDEGGIAARDGGTDGGDGGAVDREWPLVLPDKGVCTVEGWCWAAPTPLGDSLSGVWGAGPTDVWFVGHGETGTLAHYDGTAVRGLTGLSTEWGSVVTGTGANDVWVLGGPHALHYDGAAFTRMDPGTTKPLRAAHAVDAKLAFAVGDAGTIVKWDGVAWAPFGSGTTDDLTAVWAFGEDDVWVAGTNAYHWNGTGWGSAGACVAFWGDAANDLFCIRGGVALARFDGTKWTDVGAIGTTPVRGLWGTGPNDVMVLSRDVTYRYDGKTFAVAAAAGGVAYDDSSPHGVGLWGSSASAYFAAGPRVDGAPGSLFRFDGTAWSAFGENLAPATAPCTHQSTTFVGTGIAWTASSEPATGNKLERWNGTAYTDYSPGTTEPLLAMDALSAVDIWVTAGGGDVTHWDGTDWTPSNVGATTDLSAVYAASATSVWAGGGTGSIFEYDGTTWNDRSVKMKSLTALFGTSPTDVWAVGDVTYHRTKDWDAVELPKAWPRLVALWGTVPDNLRGVALSADSPESCATACDPSCKGAVLAWDGTSFTLLAAGAPACGDTTRPVFTSFYSRGLSAWATDGKSVYHWDDTAWTREVLPGEPGDVACGIASDTAELLVAGPYPVLRQKALSVLSP